jgi:hypothetical protein
MVLMLLRWSWRRFLEKLPSLSRGLSHPESRDSAQCSGSAFRPSSAHVSFTTTPQHNLPTFMAEMFYDI